MRNLIMYTLMLLFLSGCGSVFRIQQSNEILPNGATVVERGFGIPEHFGNFTMEIKRRTTEDGNSDFFYLRAERASNERLPVTALLLSVDGKVYQISGANARTKEGDDPEQRPSVEPDNRDSRRYFTRQIETFIIPKDLIDMMIRARGSIVITLVAENVHYGANLYEGKDLQKLINMLRTLDSNK